MLSGVAVSFLHTTSQSCWLQCCPIIAAECACKIKFCGRHQRPKNHHMESLGPIVSKNKTPSIAMPGTEVVKKGFKQAQDVRFYLS